MIHKFTKSDTHFTELQFVVKALAKKDLISPYKTMIYATQEGEQQFVGTDGHRLHLYDAPGHEPALPAGYYEVIKNTKTELHIILSDYADDYPDFNRVIPANEGLKGFPTDTSLWGKLAIVIREMPEGTLNPALFEAAVGNSHICMYKAAEAYTPVLFKGGHLTAVVMPMRS